MKSLLETLMVVEDVTMFGDGELYLSEEYCTVRHKAGVLFKQLVETYGQEIVVLLDEYTEAVEAQQDFIAEHYFEQGYLAGRRR